MEKVDTHEIWSFMADSEDAVPTTSVKVRRSTGHYVDTYFNLAMKVAELQFRNRSHVLLFRGQTNDHKTSKGAKGSLLKPTIFRLEGNAIPKHPVLARRFRKLRLAEQLLVDEYRRNSFLGGDRLARHDILRWAILQHYGVCDTPLLDVTHSLRIAATFGSFDLKRSLDMAPEGFLYALAVPNISGAITTSSESGLQVIRLSSACPPSAVRPHMQEGYLLGEYPEVADSDQHIDRDYWEYDFGRRLIAKFRFHPRKLWHSGDFPHVPLAGLLPRAKRDRLSEVSESIKQSIERLQK